MTCPFCNSIAIADLVDGGRTCLDCEECWLPKSTRRFMSSRERHRWQRRHRPPVASA